MRIVFLFLLITASAIAADRTPIRIKMEGSGLVIRHKASNGELLPTGRTLSNATVEVSVPTPLLEYYTDYSKIDMKEFFQKWKKEYPDDFKIQMSFAYQPITIISNTDSAPSQTALYASLDFLSKRADAKMRVMPPNEKINTNPSCAWIEEQIPHHPPIHAFAKTEGDSADCLFCGPQSSAAATVLSQELSRIRENYLISRECINVSMQKGVEIVRSRLQRCNGDTTLGPAIKPTCITPELVKFNQQAIVDTALCFDLNPRNMFPAVHHESRFFSNIQARGGDTGFLQLTGPFVAEQYRLYGNDLLDLDKIVPKAQHPACDSIREAYESNPPLNTRQKSMRCSWTNPITNLVLTAVHFKNVTQQQTALLQGEFAHLFDAYTIEKIAALVATHAHHVPSSKARLRYFLNTAAFKAFVARHHKTKGSDAKISFEDFVTEYSRGYGGDAGSYLRSVLKDYRLLSKDRPNCGW